MAKFQYTAIDATGKEKKGFLQAEDDHEATNQLKMQGLFPTSVVIVGGKKDAQIRQAGTGFGGFLAPRIKVKDLTITTRQLATLLEAGLPLVRALRTLQRQAKGNKPSTFKVMSSLAEIVESGATFSEALASHPRTFNKLYVSMVRAGEASGAMEIVLQRLAEFMEKAARIAGKVKSAMVYPIAVLIIALAITAGLMIFIIPEFGEMFKEMLPGVPLPGVTQFVITCSDVLRFHFLTIVVCIIGILVIMKLLLKTKIGGYIFDLLCLKMPPFNSLVVKTVSARFCRTLGTLMASGVAILQSLMIVKDTCGNDVVAEAVQTVHEAVKEGEGMTKPLESSGVFPLMLCSMVEVGEETGALPDMLNRVAVVYEEEVDRAVEALTSLIEPIMIIFLATIIGTIVVAMFAPMVTMIEKLG